MSEITLDTFVAYKPARNEGSFEFYPTPKDVAEKGGRTKIVLSDIPLPEGMPYPTEALTMLYGFKDALDELKNQHQRAASNNMELVKVTVKLDVGDLISGSINESNVGQTRFLRLRMASADLQQTILDMVNRLSAERSGADAEIFEKMLNAGSRPDLLCDAIRALPQLRHINSVAYHIPDGTPSGRQIASIFSSDFTDVSFRGEGAFDIELPSLD